MIFSLDLLRARKGDCFLLHFGSKDVPGLVMIDGGPKAVYQPYLKKRLLQVRTARRLTDEQPLPVDLAMVSHVDDDHIQGLLDLTRDEIVAIEAHQPRLLSVQSFWHNSFDAIIDHEPEGLVATLKSHFGEAAITGQLSDDERGEVEEDSSEDPEVVLSSLKVLASIEQGFRLHQDAERLGFPRNPEFDGKLIVARANAKAKDIAQGFKLTVVGPMEPDLRALHARHVKWLADLKKKGKSVPQALAAYVDRSIPNLSSIVALAEFGGKRMLLTGDARGDKIVEGLQLVGLLGPGKDSTMHVDVLKVPHHGSANNLERDFFRRITATHYVFSGNGEHGNPEREALEMLLSSQGSGNYTMHFTYPIQDIDRERKKDWLKQQAKEKTRKNKNAKTRLRPDWSPRDHSLEALFADHKEFGKKVSIVEEGQPHVINLLDDLEGL